MCVLRDAESGGGAGGQDRRRGQVEAKEEVGRTDRKEKDDAYEYEYYYYDEFIPVRRSGDYYYYYNDDIDRQSGKSRKLMAYLCIHIYI